MSVDLYGSYLGSFLRYSTISVQKHNFATSPLFKAPSKFPNYLLYGKSRILGLPENLKGIGLSTCTHYWLVNVWVAL